MPEPASRATLEGQDFYRIKETLQNNGDIFEIDVGAAAIAVGPESDISAYDIYYYDPLAPDNVQKFLLTAEQPFMTGLFSRNASEIPGSRTGPNAVGNFNVSIGGKLLIIPRDLFVPDALQAVAGATATLTIIPPVVDLLVFTKMPAQLPTRRPPKRLSFPVVLDSLAAGGFNFFAFPVYGRRRITGIIRGILTGAGTPDIAWITMRFLQPFSDAFGGTASISADVAGGTIAATSEAGFNYNANDSIDANSGGPYGGTLDYLFFLFTAPADNDPAASSIGGVQAYIDVRDD